MKKEKMNDLIDDIIEDVIEGYLRDEAIAYPISKREKNMLRNDIIGIFEKHDKV